MAWDIEGDNKLYSSRLQCWYESAKCLIQKMINSNSQDAIYKPEWGVESTIAWRNTGITDELSWLGSSYRVQQLVPCWVRARVAHTYTQIPFCNPLFINTLSSLCKGREDSSLKLRQNHISTLMPLKLVTAFPRSSDSALLSQLAVVIFEWYSIGFPVPKCPCTGWEMELIHFNIRHEEATKSEIQCFTSAEWKLMSCEKLS